MALEKECDIVLPVIFKYYIKGNVPEIQKILTKENIYITDSELGSVLAKLYTEGFLEGAANVNESGVIVENTAKMSITLKGIAFLSTDTFTERKERWDLEKRIKKQQSKLNDIELVLKPYTFWVACLGVFISIVALYISLHKSK